MYELFTIGPNGAQLRKRFDTLRDAMRDALLASHEFDASAIDITDLETGEKRSDFIKYWDEQGWLDFFDDDSVAYPNYLRPPA